MEASIDTKIALMQKDIETIKTDVSELKETLQNFIEHSETRFASKWVESGMRWGIIFVMAAVLTAILTQILK